MSQIGSRRRPAYSKTSLRLQDRALLDLQPFRRDDPPDSGEALAVHVSRLRVGGRAEPASVVIEWVPVVDHLQAPVSAPGNTKQFAIDACTGSRRSGGRQRRPLLDAVVFSVVD